MELIHADSSLKEVGYIKDFDTYDAQISQEAETKLQDNSWSLKMSDALWLSRPINVGDYIYIPETEWGGQVESLRHNTSLKQLTLSGLTWRGALYRKVIEPPPGSNYLTIQNKEANAALRQIVGAQLGAAFLISTAASGITITEKSFRYINMLHGTADMLLAHGAAMHINFSQTQRAAILSARKTNDYSAQIDLSQDYGVDMVSILGGYDRYNHIIALGAGELEDRDILHVYRLADGSMTTDTPSWAGTAIDHARTYDYNNPETLEHLRKGAEKLLIECTPHNTVEMDPRVEGLTLEMGDRVGARDRITGMSAVVQVVGKILIMNEKGIRIETKVG